MKSTIRFDRRFDVPRLERDLEAAERAESTHIHYNRRDHDGGWSAIPLVSMDGRTDADALKGLRGTYSKTRVLRACPYFEEIVDSFQCQKHRVRLMRLAAGGRIFEHRDDATCSWAFGVFARMHIPIVTHPDVHFRLDGHRLDMKPGELWYLDVSRPHSVVNSSPLERVHLVIDLKVNSWLREMFPEESLWERGRNVVQRLRHGRAGRRLLAITRSIGLSRSSRRG